MKNRCSLSMTSIIHCGLKCIRYTNQKVKIIRTNRDILLYIIIDLDIVFKKDVRSIFYVFH